jgi:hypothetical protein
VITADSPESAVFIQISNNKVFRAYLAVFTVALTNSLAEIFLIAVFFGVNFCGQTPGTHANHAVSMALDGMP